MSPGLLDKGKTMQVKVKYKVFNVRSKIHVGKLL